MENDYGVGVSNRYELFLEEEEDPLEMLRNQEQLKEAKKKTKLQEKENRGTSTKVEPAKVNKPAPPAAKKQIKETQNLKSVDVVKPKEGTRLLTAAGADNNKMTGSRGPRPSPSVKFAPESREERNNRRNRDDRITTPGDARESNDSENRGRGRGMGRGGRGGRGSWRGSGGAGQQGGQERQGEYRPKREFDRHSGSDKSSVKPMDKRDGGGAHNWGTYRDEINEPLDSNYLAPESQEWSSENPKPATDAPTDMAAEAKETEGTDGEGQPANEESPAKELTLDEWKALRGNRQKPTFNIRKAGEGEDPSQWKKMYALKKKEGEEDDEDDEEYEIAEYPQRVGRQKHLLDIDIHFSDSRRGGRGRGGGRGIGRGGGASRGGGRGGPDRSGPGGEVGRGGAGGGGGGGENRGRGNNGGGGDNVGGERPGPGSGGGGGGGSGSFYQAAQPVVNQAPVGPKNAGRANYSRQHQSAPKVDDEKDFPSLG